MTGAPRAILFDMDGVIVDSEVYWHEAENERLLPAVLGDERPDDGETTGMNYREIYDYLSANYEVEVERNEFVALYEDVAREIYTEKVSLMSGFRELCADLGEAGVTTAIVSSSPHEWIAIVTDRFGVRVDRVVSAEDIDGPGKPEPGIYEHAAEVVGVRPDRCVVVEDSQNGIEAAARAGMTVIGYHGEANRDLDLSMADVVVSGPDELRDELRRRVGDF